MANRERLFAEDCRCHWCGRVTFMPGHPDYTKGRLATLDHVKSWPEASGLQEWSAPSNMVLACRACNERRSHEWCIRTQSPKKWAAYQAKTKNADR